MTLVVVLAASCIGGAALCFAAAYAVLVFGPDLDASHFGF